MMQPLFRSLAVVGVALIAPASVGAANCSAKVTIGGKKAMLSHCSVALYDGRGVTLFVTEGALSDEERSAFEVNSYPQDTDPEGKARTMMSFSFCAGPTGGAPDLKAIHSVEVSVNHASSILLQRQWVIDRPGDDGSRLDIESLTGTLALGGSLTGRITGKAESDYAWDVSFDLTLPATEAVSGPGCD